MTLATKTKRTMRRRPAIEIPSKKTTRKSAPRTVATLTVKQLRELIDESVRKAITDLRQDDDWDRQMTADAKAGRLDSLIATADAEIRAGKTMPLKFIGNKLK